MLGHHGISDPGEVVVKAAIENNIEIIPIPGACAAINALILSLIHISEPTRHSIVSRMPSSA